MFSRHFANAEWQKLEIDAATWNEVAQDGGHCLVVRLDATPIPPLLGPKVYGQLNEDDADALRKLVEAICNVSLQGDTAASVVAQALSSASKNPFRHLRAEYFENRPDLHARTFAPPDALKVGALEEMKPCVLEGSRGTGKSMLLLSLRARNMLLRDRPADGRVRIFGFYLKLSRGAICNVGLSATQDDPPLPFDSVGGQIMDMASQEIIIQLLESLFSEVAYCVDNGHIDCDDTRRRLFAQKVDEVLFDSTTERASSLEDLLDKLAHSHKRIAEYIRRRFIYAEEPK